ncbi:sia-alpha-2,3-Gal-beta-1,4-GlcNAc-R:alpha 2,8-sialyltransferase-like [Anneissia japonica]|uniref:sia-alpha-2,3-Gal-beta-1,4-GlcNAc-R:alpha 2,8-sialyltransferase-like n=1 Tax=Anneissia japonica TaxID=1529436 RepID=UPI001425AC09|nr:sia-alpha-2,3-Gal-beta-1,4-GlcNAc-R:alpha 2,8-sialyltransferase-like [Anneissia japonica]
MVHSMFVVVVIVTIYVVVMLLRYKKLKPLNVALLVLVILLVYQLYGLTASNDNGYRIEKPKGNSEQRIAHILLEAAYCGINEDSLQTIERSLLCQTCRIFNQEQRTIFRYQLRLQPNSSSDMLVMAKDNVYFNESIQFQKSPLVGKHFKSCSVVGNSGILQNSDCGAEIDKSDYIFRCNMAPIKPFGKDAGYRMHFTTMNPSLLKNRYNTFDRIQNISDFREDTSRQTGLIWIPVFGDNYWTRTCFRAYHHHRTTNSKIVFGHPEHFKAIWRFWEKRGLQTWPSTGFYLATTALDLCDEVHLFGFWPFHKRYYPEPHDVKYHYYEHLPWAKKHNMTSEFQLLWQLHMDGILKIHIGRCQQ